MPVVALDREHVGVVVLAYHLYYTILYYNVSYYTVM